MMDSPRLNFYKGMLALLLLLQTAGGAMAQNRSHNKSHDRHQNIAHNKPRTGAPLSDKLMGSIELISGLGLGHKYYTNLIHPTGKSHFFLLPLHPVNSQAKL